MSKSFKNSNFESVVIISMLKYLQSCILILSVCSAACGQTLDHHQSYGYSVAVPQTMSVPTYPGTVIVEGSRTAPYVIGATEGYGSSACGSCYGPQVPTYWVPAHQPYNISYSQPVVSGVTYAVPSAGSELEKHVSCLQELVARLETNVASLVTTTNNNTAKSTDNDQSLEKIRGGLEATNKQIGSIIELLNSNQNATNQMIKNEIDKFRGELMDFLKSKADDQATAAGN